MRVLAPGTAHKLANPSLKIKFSCRVLWRETLVVVVVSADHDFSVGGIERIPKAALLPDRCRVLLPELNRGLCQ